MKKHFVSPHCHIQSLDSASTPESFIKRELELNTGHITCTDHGTLVACKKVYDLAKKNSLTPILGVEAYVRDDSDPILMKNGIPRNEENSYADYIKYYHLTMHCMDYDAYETLVKLISKADDRAEQHGSERKPLFDWNNLEELGSKNVTMMSSCLAGMVMRHLVMKNDPYTAKQFYERLRSIVKPENFYVEIFPHVCDKYWVKGVFLTTVNSSGVISETRYYTGKKVKTDIGEITVADLAKEFKKTNNKHTRLIAIKDGSKWNEIEEAKLIKVEYIEDFFKNECLPWSPDGDLQKGANEYVMYLAKKYGDKILISDDSHFAYPEDKIVQDVKLMSSGGSWRFYGSHHRYDNNEAHDYFTKVMNISKSEFDGWVENSHQWGSRFKDFKFKNYSVLPKKFYPSDTLSHVYQLIENHGRMNTVDSRYKDRLNKEIQLFHKNGEMDFLPYFFVVEEACKLYEDNGMLTGIARGSGGGVLLNYLLGITHLDPIKEDLSLERFLTLDRIQSGKMPDIDTDFPDRTLLIEWLNKRFGDHYAQISTETALKLKSSVKDVARVKYGRVPKEIAELSENFETAPQGVTDRNFVFGYENGEGRTPGSIEYDPNLKKYVSNYPSDWETVQKLLGVNRSYGRHASANLISDIPIKDFIPVTTISGIKCTQYDMEGVESVGGIKFDFLTVNSLNDISECIKLIQNRSGKNLEDYSIISNKKIPRARIVIHNGELLDIWDLPEKQDIFKEIASGKTETVFQFNTAAAQKWLRYFNEDRPNGNKVLDSIKEMAIFTALDRPGPLDAYVEAPDGSRHNMLVEYVSRALGKEKSKTLDVFDGLIPETNDLLCFQESVQSIYQHFTGCTLTEAETFRYNVGKKYKEKILKAYSYFMEKAGNKVGKEKAQKIWDAIVTFSEYGFNKSHAFAYAKTGYACAYLKYYFPLEWWTAVLGNASKDEVNEDFWAYCGNLIDLPDINLSGEKFEIVGQKLKAPISLLKGVGEAAHRQLLAGRPYKNIDDFCEKIQKFKTDNAKKVTKKNKRGEIVDSIRKATSALNRGVVYKLIISGVMDSLFPNSTTMLEKFALYESSIAKATDENPEAINPIYSDLNQLSRYQMIKSILPAYSLDLAPILFDRKIDNVVKENNVFRFKTSKGSLRFLSGTDLDRLESEIIDEKGVSFAVASYVIDAENFSYKGDRQACGIELDICGKRIRMVKWNIDPKSKDKFSPKLKGSIVIALLKKYEENKPPVVNDIIIIQNPFMEKKEDK